ncbi:MAG: LysR family transcriptional regulator, partial [Rhodobacterales bacterium]|nr:LysR family transcriptional regulator [Rhodobacterales bacterium]
MTDWDDLRIFLGVVRGESLAAAGRALRLDPATVHRRIARLEEALGATLFTRSPQGHLLTEAGQRLVAHAEAAEQALSAAAEDLGGRPDRLSGQIRIGAPDGCANYLLPQVLAEIAAAHPELELQVVALPRVFNLTRREADLAIAVSPPSGGRLRVQRLADYRLHLAAHRDYLARAGRPATPADLARHRMIGYIPDMIFDKELDYLAEIGAPPVRLASNSVSVQLNWLRADLGQIVQFLV